MSARVAVVIATRDRRAELLSTLAHLRALEECPRVVVVDNDSSDGTSEAARAAGAEVIELRRNRGGAARTVGARAVEEPYVAFADDDSWWARGALGRAADLLDRHPRLGLVAARVLVGPDAREDAVCGAMTKSPLPPEPELPGTPVLGFVACGAVVRRAAFLAAGGFHPRFGIGGEEELLALDLARAGWGVAYVPEVVAHHHPSLSRDPRARGRGQARNALWCAWLRSPGRSLVRRSAQVLKGAGGGARLGLLDAAVGLPWVLRERRVVPPRLDAALRALEQE